MPGPWATNNSLALAISMPQCFVSFSSVERALFDFVAGTSARDHHPAVVHDDHAHAGLAPGTVHDHGEDVHHQHHG